MAAFLPAWASCIADTDPMLRNRLVAWIGHEPELGTDEAQTWLTTHFNHADLDCEKNHAVPFFTISHAESQRLPAPPDANTEFKTIAPADLGPVSASELPLQHLARALWLIMAFSAH